MNRKNKREGKGWEIKKNNVFLLSKSIYEANDVLDAFCTRLHTNSNLSASEEVTPWAQTRLSPLHLPPLGTLLLTLEDTPFKLFAL